MLEAERLQIKGEISVMDGPLLGQIKKFPLAAAFLAAVVVAVLLFPAGVCPGGIPDYLRVGPDQQVFAPSFQFFSF